MPPRKPRLASKPAKPEPAPVTVSQVDKLTLAVALDLAGGDPRRLRVIDEHTVEIRNNPDHA